MQQPFKKNVLGRWMDVIIMLDGCFYYVMDVIITLNGCFITLDGCFYYVMDVFIT